MSSEREEIRWQFQMLLDLSQQGLGSLQNHRDRLLSEFQFNDRKISEFRNFIAGILGFVATLMVSLIAIGYLNDPNIPYIEYSISIAIIGFIIYFSINWFVLYKRAILHQKLDTKFAEVLSNHQQIRTLISSLGANIAIPLEKIAPLRIFVVTLNDAMLYDLYNYSSKILGTKKPDQEPYRISYSNAKSMEEELEKYNFPIGKEINKKFIEDFEKNEKSSNYYTT